MLQPVRLNGSYVAFPLQQKKNNTIWSIILNCTATKRLNQQHFQKCIKECGSHIDKSREESGSTSNNVSQSIPKNTNEGWIYPAKIPQTNKGQFPLVYTCKPIPKGTSIRWLNIIVFLPIYYFQYEHGLFLFGAMSDHISHVQSREKALLTAKYQRKACQWIKQLILSPADEKRTRTQFSSR